MDRSTLRSRHPSAWTLLCCLQSAPEDGPPNAEEMGWTESKFRAALCRLEAFEMVAIETVKQRRRIKLLAAAAVTASGPTLASLQARQDRCRPIRFSEAALHLSDGTHRPLPASLRRPEFYDMWQQFASLCDQRLESEGLPFRAELFFKELLKIAEGLQEGNSSHNNNYVLLSWEKYVISGLYNIEIPNSDELSARKFEATGRRLPPASPTSGRESPAPGPVANPPALRSTPPPEVVAAIKGMEKAGYATSTARAAFSSQWDDFVSDLARIPGGKPNKEEIQMAAEIAMKNAMAKGVKEPKYFSVLEVLRTMRNPEKLPKRVEARMKTELDREIVEAFNMAKLNPDFVPEMEKRLENYWPGITAQSEKEARMLELFEGDYKAATPKLSNVLEAVK
jgi:hypothetical protein